MKAFKKKQQGVALLALMLVIVIGASYLLLRDMNTVVRRASNEEESTRALKTAKLALMGWAVNHPVYPGALPMPDRNGDGDYDGDSDCYNGGAIGNNLLLGKLPWRDAPGPCKDSALLSGLGINVTDSSGEQLWYAVSHNLVYETPEYPFISLSILYKTTDSTTPLESLYPKLSILSIISPRTTPNFINF